MSFVDLLGYAASAAVLATFCMSTMIPLRIMALVSNLLFMAYGYVDHVYPVFMLHAILFPVSALRLIRFQRLVRDIRDAHREDLSIQSLLPYMTRKTLSMNKTLVSKGEKADRLFYLLDGEMEVVELNKILKPGAMIGEIGVFARNQTRAATVKCRTDCNVFELTEHKAKDTLRQLQCSCGDVSLLPHLSRPK